MLLDKPWDLGVAKVSTYPMGVFKRNESLTCLQLYETIRNNGNFYS